MSWIDGGENPRRGHRVRWTLNGVPFESVIVPRSRRFYVLVDDQWTRAAKVEAGDQVDVVLEAREAPPG